MNCCCNNSISTKDAEIVNPILDKYKGLDGSLISILQDIQSKYNYLPIDVLGYISDKTGIKKAKILGVASFYTQFRLSPVGKHVIMLCQGTACHVNGSKAIEKAIYEELGIEDGQTTDDDLFTLENVACLGCCSLSPVMMIDGKAYGKLTPKKAKSIINEIKNADTKEV